MENLFFFEKGQNFDTCTKILIEKMAEVEQYNLQVANNESL